MRMAPGSFQNIRAQYLGRPEQSQDLTEVPYSLCYHYLLPWQTLVSLEDDYCFTCFLLVVICRSWSLNFYLYIQTS